MASNNSEIEYEFPLVFRAYRDGRIERLIDTDFVPPSVDPQTGVSSKDVVINPESSISARLYLPPNLTTTQQKLPLLVYFHGGGFWVSSAFAATYHNFVNSLVSKANVVAVSVEYRLAPEHPVPIAYEDSWNAVKWVASHCKGDGSEPWLNEFADFDKMFLSGDSAGANITHNMAMLAGQSQTALNVRLLGAALIHPYFWGSESIGTELKHPWKVYMDGVWPYACRYLLDNDHPNINPMAPGAPSLANLGCSRVLVCVAEKDALKDRGWLYYETLAKCGWKGVAEIMETKGEEHVFFVGNPTCDNAKDLIARLAVFLKGERVQ